MGRSSVLPCIAAAAGLALLLYGLYRRDEDRRRRIRELETSLAKAAKERQAERTGRIKAQKELRERLSQGTAAAPSSFAADTNAGPHTATPAVAAGHVGGAVTAQKFPMTAIGVLKSCFNTRNGTPRQPLLCQHARSCLQLHHSVPPSTLDGLADFSHCWLLYVFHANTDLTRLWDTHPHARVQAKIRVPRLDGAKRGCLATRSPHRPNPLGLSVAKVERVAGNRVFLSGADIVDGTPVLDIKPYLAYCDSVLDATGPPWAQAADGPLEVNSVTFKSTVDKELQQCWEVKPTSLLYANWNDLKALAGEVLGRDIRSSWQRHLQHQGPTKGGLSFLLAPDAASAAQGQGKGGLVPAADCDVAGHGDSHPATESDVAEGGAPSSCTLQSRDIGTDQLTENGDVVYHVLLDGVDFRYHIRDKDVYVFSACLPKKNETETSKA